METLWQLVRTPARVPQVLLDRCTFLKKTGVLLIVGDLQNKFRHLLQELIGFSVSTFPSMGIIWLLENAPPVVLLTLLVYRAPDLYTFIREILEAQTIGVLCNQSPIHFHLLQAHLVSIFGMTLANQFLFQMVFL